MKKVFTILVVALAVTHACAQKLRKNNLVADFDFCTVEGRIVKDNSSKHNDATIMGCAQVQEMGDSQVLWLGNDDGYLDLGLAIGQQLKNANEFTIEVTYMVDDSASLKGQGYFLWAFSTLEQNTQEEGRYHAYKLNAQRGENSVGGWKHESILHINKPSDKGVWQTVRYSQKGTKGTLKLNGVIVATNDEMFSMQETFPTEAPTFNWMGRAPFKGDSYLKNTYIRSIKIWIK